MGTSVRLAPILQEHLGIPGTVEASGRTVGECLDDLTRHYPELGRLIRHGDMLRVLIGINNEEVVPVYSAPGLERVVAPGDEIRILAILSGG